MPPRNEPTTRTCIVTREALPAERADPIRRRRRTAPWCPTSGAGCPAAGVWVTADAPHVRAAERKRLFARGLGEEVKVEPGLADRVAALLREAALSALSLARKAGTLVTGFAKVEIGARPRARSSRLIHAAEAGKRRDCQARRRRPAAGWARRRSTFRSSESFRAGIWVWLSAGQM